MNKAERQPVIAGLTEKETRAIETWLGWLLQVGAWPSNKEAA